jgi:prepilin-type N-terminal cleavage/methylation domain-containing protein
MLQSTHRRVSGFTLTEMAIVLAVVGVLAAGLWNLLAGANTQVRDQAAASQQEQLVNAVKTFLVSSGGQQFMTNNGNCGGNCGGTTVATDLPFNLPLPTAGCGGLGVMSGGVPAGIESSTWCNDLPPGFTSATTNSYGQKYLIQILRDTTPTTQPPNSYSFMIMTTGGNAITDTSGSRISSLIGGDGGFIYSAAAGVCGTPVANWACGSYGGWAATPNATYGFATASASGTIASRTYYSPAQNTFTNWLARIQLPGDSNFTFNSMTVPEYLGGNELDMGAFNAGVQANSTATTGGGGGWINLEEGTLNFGYSPNPGGAAPASGTMNMQGGTINAGGGTINMQAGTINLQAGQILGAYGAAPPAGVAGAAINLLAAAGTRTPNLINVNMDGSGPTGSNPPVTIATGCTGDPNAANPALPFSNGCVQGLQVLGDVGFSGSMNANSSFSQTFIYQGSDIRLKKNIVPLHDSLDDIMNLNPVSYDLKSGHGSGLGVIAQDLEKIYPQLVSQMSNGMKAVNYEGLIAPLIDSVQELKRENDELKAKLHEQDLRENKLERQLRDSQ